MEELVLMSSVLRLSMVSLIPLLTELLSSQLQDRHTLPEPQNPKLRWLRLPAQADAQTQTQTHTVPEAAGVTQPQAKLLCH